MAYACHIQCLEWRYTSHARHKTVTCTSQDCHMYIIRLSHARHKTNAMEGHTAMSVTCQVGVVIDELTLADV